MICVGCPNIEGIIVGSLAEFNELTTKELVDLALEQYKARNAPIIAASRDKNKIEAAIGIIESLENWRPKDEVNDKFMRDLCLVILGVLTPDVLKGR